MFTVSKTVDDNSYLTFALPAATQGTVYIQVVDSDRTLGNRAADSIWVDHLFIRSETAIGGVLPAVPANLTATAVSASQIDLAWTDKSGEEEYGFKIERSLDGGITWQPLGTTPKNVAVYSDTGLDPNTTYHYRVAAYNGAGTSAWAVPASTTTFPGVALTAYGYKVKGKHTFDLNWSGATTDNVHIYRADDGAAEALIVTTENDGFHIDEIGAKGSANYGYRLCEATTSGICSDLVEFVF